MSQVRCVQAVGCVIAWVAITAGAHAAKLSSLDDCSIKPILGTRFAQAQDDWSLELEYKSDKGFDPSKLRLPIYGNWCGPNHPRPGTSPPAYDKLDAVCMAHDQCYERSGYSDCTCDMNLVTALRTARKNNEDLVRCHRQGRWTTERNPFYLTVEHHFSQDMAKRGCVIPAQPAVRRPR